MFFAHLSSPTELHATAMQPKVYEIYSLQEIDIPPGPETRFILDLDDTLYTHGYQGQFLSLGSRAWRKDLLSYLEKKLESWLQENPSIPIPKDHSTKQIAQTLHDYLTWTLVHHLPIQAMEPETIPFIEKLQKQNCNISFCTAREKNIWYWLKGLHVTDEKGLPVAAMTTKQVQSLGLQIPHDPLFKTEFFINGIHFVPYDSKGEYFTLEMLPALKLSPYEFIFIDDKRSNCESMAQAFSKAGLPHRCYYYRAVDKWNEKYNPLLAAIQLHTLWQSKTEILSDEQAQRHAQLHPEQTIDDYLKPIIFDVLQKYYAPKG